ncbi:MAG TPA: FAD-dependent oxidoreductase [Anaerolineaceae bacterium]|nr:FAD-dependent oxidoreductase [Anaerolineaceae bacterium]
MRKQAIVVGSGAGGATAAKELQGAYDVTLLEAGRAFKPFGLPLNGLEMLRQAGLFFDEREIRMAIPAYKTCRTKDQMVLVNGIGLGGTTTICTGNALRMDRDLQRLGINLDAEFEEIYREIPVTTAHQRRWKKVTRRLFAIFQELDLDPQPMPKMGAYERCVHCGRCQLGCPQGIKWDSRQFVQAAQAKGARVISNCQVERVTIEGQRATGVIAKSGLGRHFFPADLVVLAAGGFATPVILDRSGVPCEAHLFVDPVLCVAGRSRGCKQHQDVTMPFVSSRDHTILSPYFDHLSFFFNKDWRIPADDVVSIMIKLADDALGSISSRGVAKTLTCQDHSRLDEGVAICREILRRFGVDEAEQFLGTVIAGHPGGMLPLTENEATSIHSNRLPDNLYVADASLLPQSLGNPPILTIIALAKRISKVCMS